MNNNNTKISIEISEFYEYVNPNECAAVVSKLFFKYCADKSADKNFNILTKEQINGIHEILNFICNNNCINQGQLINSILPLKNKINQRSGLNEIFFHAISQHVLGKIILELEEIRIIKDLFELLNNLEIIRECETNKSLVNEDIALNKLVNHIK